MPHFVTEFDEFLTPLTALGNRIPTIDTDALLDILIEHIEHGVSVSWHDRARELLYKGEIIEAIHLNAPNDYRHYLDERSRWENIPLATNDAEMIVDAIARVGMGIEAHLRHWGLYSGSTLQYAFQGRVRYDLYEFVPKPNA